MTAHELAPCMDCGGDTTPCTGRRGCRHAGRWEWYMVHERVWFGEAGAGAGFLHIRCLERRIGRGLHAGDFTRYPVNLPHPWDSPDLVAAKERRPPVRRRVIVRTWK